MGKALLLMSPVGLAYGYVLQSSDIGGIVFCFGLIVFIVIAMSKWLHNSKQYSKKIAGMREQQRRLLENSRLSYLNHWKNCGINQQMPLFVNRH